MMSWTRRQLSTVVSRDPRLRKGAAITHLTLCKVLANFLNEVEKVVCPHTTTASKLFKHYTILASH